MGKLRTPSKILSARLYIPYYVRYVLHGEAIKYSSIEKTINNKGILPPQGYRIISYLGFINYIDFLDNNKGSVFAKNFINENNILSENIRLDIVGLLKDKEILKDVLDGATISVFIYKFK